MQAVCRTRVLLMPLAPTETVVHRLCCTMSRVVDLSTGPSSLGEGCFQIHHPMVTGVDRLHILASVAAMPEYLHDVDVPPIADSE
jgi:hypothetical protein